MLGTKLRLTLWRRLEITGTLEFARKHVCQRQTNRQTVRHRMEVNYCLIFSRKKNSLKIPSSHDLEIFFHRNFDIFREKNAKKTHKKNFKRLFNKVVIFLSVLIRVKGSRIWAAKILLLPSHFNLWSIQVLN